MAAALCVSVAAQEKSYTKDEILSMSIEQLSELPLEDLMQAVETLGVSSVDELFALIMNKNVSSASKKEESSFTSPLGTTVITHDELRTWGCSTIEEAFRLIPGMIVQQKTNGVYDVQMRGLNNIPDNNMLLYTENNNTLLMVDGRSLHDYGIGTFNAEHLPISIEDVERIEVVRGAASALYGANAVNGVVNIITRKPDQVDNNVAGSFQMGSQGTNIGDVAFRWKFSDKVAAGVSLNMQYRERPTNKYRVLSGSTLYLDEAESIDWTTPISANDVQTYVANGTLKPVSANDELSVDQFKYLREVSSNLSMTAVFARVQQLYAGAYEAAIKAGQSEQEAQIAAVTYAVQQMSGAITPAQVANPPIYSLYYTTPIEYRDASKVLKDPWLARKSMGANGYFAITPAADVRIDLTGGYSQNFVNTNALIENPYSMNERIYKTGYTNIDASIKDLHLLINYAGESGTYSYGRPGFRIFTHKLFGTAEYDINLGDADTWGTLAIRPGINYQYIYSSDKNDYFDYGEGDVKMPGFFDGNAKMTSIAPALRLDYKIGDFRAIFGVRSDKTNIPDKWNTSYQAALSYKINEKNFVRASYGRAMRSAALVNACANYKWLRSNGMGAPNEIDFLVNEDANLMHADNVELGYRIQPTQNLLIDAEVFYSLSKDYTGMMARNVDVSFGRQAALASVDARNSMVVLQTIQTKGTVQAGNFPYEVKQIGAGVNVDWIISPKLIAKFNMNAQQTKIDNYYSYDQNAVFKKLIEASLTTALTTTATVLEAVNKEEGDENRRARALEMFQNFANDGTITVTEDRIIVGAMDTKKLDTSKKLDKQIYEILNPQTTNGHKHKATPSVYGMVGVIAKPISQLNISAYANFMGEREYLTAYGTQVLSPRFNVNLKVGYKPAEQLEVFFNGNNILNNCKQEVVFCDKIGGIYTVGVNFNF
ncbi:MAG: TonB-dependent receptor [Bacteroidales bacterium]|nr:TonB-dependent receptor [Bacteroidales bacterium]